ncbi:hypothetical protein CMV_030792 [Castanea mollissima]|uniref:Uncharacterized protein n=1 Tax=Castanea mollissima TaxID=60419 RepID=A0A8J4QC14_9ROSI|nr:hypothetical protein CMV_030792 [Castanea mollissima]
MSRSFRCYWMPVLGQLVSLIPTTRAHFTWLAVMGISMWSSSFRVSLGCRGWKNIVLFKIAFMLLFQEDIQLYVWDESEYLPLLVRNKAAEILFGNITAESVYLCYREEKHDWQPDPKDVHKDRHFCTSLKSPQSCCWISRFFFIRSRDESQREGKTKL